eukprot:6380444-Amphidinium_carterae.1
MTAASAANRDWCLPEAMFTEIVGTSSLPIGDLELSEEDAFKSAPNGPEMIGLASAGDTGPTAVCKLTMTKLIEAQISKTPPERTVTWSVVVMVTMATIGSLTNRSDLTRTETHAWILFSAIAIVTAFRLFTCRTVEWPEETSAVHITTVESFRLAYATGFEAIAAMLSIGKTRDEKGTLVDLRRKLIEHSGKTFGLLVSTVQRSRGTSRIITWAQARRTPGFLTHVRWRRRCVA